MGKIINGCPVSPAKQKLLSLLGPSWTMKRIDFEPCVYRDLGLYDIEISGGRTKKEEINIFVWEKGPYFTVLEKHLELHYDVDDLKAICDDIVDRWGVETDQTYTEILNDSFDKMDLSIEDMRSIRCLSDDCRQADEAIDRKIQGYVVDQAYTHHEKWILKKGWGKRLTERIKEVRQEQPEVCMKTEEWAAFQKQQEILKGFIMNLSDHKISDLLCIIKFAKTMLNSKHRSIQLARDFRDSIGNRSDNDAELQKVLMDPYEELLSQHLQLAVFPAKWI